MMQKKRFDLLKNNFLEEVLRLSATYMVSGLIKLLYFRLCTKHCLMKPTLGLAICSH